MLWGNRPDGTKIQGLSPMRALMPHIIRSRNGAVVYHRQRLDLTRTLPWLEQRTQRDGSRVTLFHLVQYALLRVLQERPQLHRFVSGGTIYQRRALQLSFAVKKKLDDAAGMTAVKVSFAPGDTLADVVRRADACIAEGRGAALLPAEQEMALASKLPVWLLGWLVALQRQLDAWNLLPAFATATDPLYASAFLANLGSIGLDAPLHHLFDWGTVPIFGAIGKVHKAPWVDEHGNLVVRETVEIAWSYDERIADGLYCARSMKILQRIVEEPELEVRG